MCGHDEDGAGARRLIELRPGETLTVLGALPRQRPTALFEVYWGVTEEGMAQAVAEELTNFDGEQGQLFNEWMIES